MIQTSDSCTLHRNREVMQELRMVLANRAREFEKREQRALAASYGVADMSEFMVKSKAPIENCTSNEQFGTRDIDDNVAIPVNHEGPRYRMPSDLLAALSVQSVVETTIGDL
ncbi:hypothetical protein DICVIV_09114 [Dictyocaulus viviparus]|uniref:Uncharacterized protein n=1 Tax=Dictyocaulus viviparus TaxID=29172 RepID=A0A0D8XM41_DICVI|nr:hypothetical protein DICVIV_09114 [Dictyocaulus viviparus]